jgi:hypothetical protein
LAEEDEIMKKTTGYLLHTKTAYYGRVYESVMHFDTREAADRRMRRNLDRAYSNVGCDHVEATMLSTDAARLDGINRKGHRVHHTWEIVDVTLWKNAYDSEK